MSEKKTQINISKADIVELLERAKALGVTNLTMNGLEFSFAAIENRQSQNENRKSSNEKNCPQCNSQLINGEYGPYCRPCYLKRKEERYQTRRQW